MFSVKNSVKGFVAKRTEKWISKNPEMAMEIIDMAKAGYGVREITKTLKAEMEIKKLALAIVVAVVVIVIAVSLLPAIYTATSGALTSNITSNSHYSSSVALVYLIPLIFVAGLLVVIIYMMFGSEK